MKKFSVWVCPKGYADFDCYYVTVEAETPEAARSMVMTEKKFYYAGCIGHVREIIDYSKVPPLSKEEQEYWSGDNS